MLGVFSVLFRKGRASTLLGRICCDQISSISYKQEKSEKNIYPEPYNYEWNSNHLQTKTISNVNANAWTISNVNANAKIISNVNANANANAKTVSNVNANANAKNSDC